MRKQLSVSTMSTGTEDGARMMAGGTTHANDACKLVHIKFFCVYKVDQWVRAFSARIEAGGTGRAGGSARAGIEI